MKHLIYFEDFLIESVLDIDTIYTKYYSSIERNTFNEIVEADPTTVLKDSKIGVYCKWLLKLYTNKNLKLEDLYKATEYISAFHQFKHKITNRDINSYKSLPELFEVVEPFLEKEDVRFTNEDERKLAGQFKEVFRNEKYRIIIPLTLDASKYFGKGTEWCTTNTNMFKKYTKKQTNDISSKNLYIFYTENPKDRLQFHFFENQYMNVRDKKINIKKFFKENSDVFDFFNSKFNVNAFITGKNNIVWNKSTFNNCPEYIDGNFDCYNKFIFSMKGSPKKVEGDFVCGKNYIKSLEDSNLEYVGGDFGCSSNSLINLIGGPKEVGDFYNCSDNKLISLEGAPQEVGMFMCSYNYLESLIGGPVKAVYYICTTNRLKNLKGAPKYIEKNFDCSMNDELVSLEGAPEYVGGNFICHNNKNLSEEEILRYYNTGAVKGNIISDYGNFEPK